MTNSTRIAGTKSLTKNLKLAALVVILSLPTLAQAQVAQTHNSLPTAVLAAGTLKAINGYGSQVLQQLSSHRPGACLARAALSVASVAVLGGTSEPRGDGAGRVAAGGLVGFAGPAPVSTGAMVRDPLAVQTKAPVMTAAAVTRVIGQGQRCIQARFQRALKQRRVSGQYQVSLEVGAQGRVRRVSVTMDKASDAGLSASIQRCFERLTFPAPQDGHATISASLVLRPSL